MSSLPPVISDSDEFPDADFFAESHPASASDDTAAPAPNRFKRFFCLCFCYRSLLFGLNYTMTFMPLYIYCTERAGGAKILTCAASYAALRVYHRNLGARIIAGHRRHHIKIAPAGQCLAQLPHSTPSVTGTQFSFTQTACPICIDDLSATEIGSMALSDIHSSI